MRTVEFIECIDGFIYALFKRNGQVKQIAFVPYDADVRKMICDWVLDGQCVNASCPGEPLGIVGG